MDKSPSKDNLPRTGSRKRKTGKPRQAAVDDVLDYSDHENGDVIVENSGQAVNDLAVLDSPKFSIHTGERRSSRRHSTREDALKKALSAVMSKELSITEACRLFRVSESDLKERLGMITPDISEDANSQVNKRAEEKLIQVICRMNKLGAKFSETDIQEMLAKKCTGKDEILNKDRNHPQNYASSVEGVQCPSCERSFTSLPQWRDHVIIAHPTVLESLASSDSPEVMPMKSFPSSVYPLSASITKQSRGASSSFVKQSSNLHLQSSQVRAECEAGSSNVSSTTSNEPRNARDQARSDRCLVCGNEDQLLALFSLPDRFYKKLAKVLNKMIQPGKVLSTVICSTCREKVNTVIEARQIEQQLKESFDETCEMLVEESHVINSAPGQGVSPIITTTVTPIEIAPLNTSEITTIKKEILDTDFDWSHQKSVSEDDKAPSGTMNLLRQVLTESLDPVYTDNAKEDDANSNNSANKTSESILGSILTNETSLNPTQRMPILNSLMTENWTMLMPKAVEEDPSAKNIRFSSRLRKRVKKETESDPDYNPIDKLGEKKIRKIKSDEDDDQRNEIIVSSSATPSTSNVALPNLLSMLKDSSKVGGESSILAQAIVSDIQKTNVTRPVSSSPRQTNFKIVAPSEKNVLDLKQLKETSTVMKNVERIRFTPGLAPQYGCDLCSKDFFFTFEAVRHHVKCHASSANDTLVCHLCSFQHAKLPTQWRIMKKHLERMHDIDPRIFGQYPCLITGCLKLFVFENERNNHMVLSHQKSTVNQQPTKIHFLLPQGLFAFKCQLCNIELHSEELLDVHLQCHQGNFKSFRCFICNYTHSSQPGSWRFMRSHLQQKHTGSNMDLKSEWFNFFECKKFSCRLKFCSLRARDVHVACHDPAAGEGHLRCYICAFVSPVLPYLWEPIRDHMIHHHPTVFGGEPKCSCGDTFSDWTEFSEHLAETHSNTVKSKVNMKGLDEELQTGRPRLLNALKGV